VSSWEVEPGNQVSSPAAASLPTSQASVVVPLVSSTAITVRPSECPEVSGYEHAEAGMLSVGSFTAEDIGPPPPGHDDRKLWIISRRKGHDDAILQLTGPGGQHRVERRKSGVSWTLVSNSSTPEVFPWPRAVSIDCESQSDATRCA
jgi:hypothetical protein